MMINSVELTFCSQSLENPENRVGG